MMPEEPDAIGICCEDDGGIMVIFSEGVTAADISAAFATLPADAWVAGISTDWYSGAEDCQGQSFEDAEHIHPVISIFLERAEIEAGVSP